jgi:hypothetical protein
MKYRFNFKQVSGFVLCVLLCIPLLGCVSKSVVAEFSVPTITVNYQDILSKYGVTIHDEISEQEAEELFAILQSMKSKTEVSSLENKYYIFLDGMKMTKQEDGTIKVQTNSNTGSTSSFGNFLYFERSGSNKWDLVKKIDWRS